MSTTQRVKDVTKSVTRTAIGGQVLSAIHLGKQHHVHEFSTLQELVNDSVAVPFQPPVSTMGKQETEPYNPEQDVDNIELGYLAIGINGHRFITDSNGIAKPFPVEHKATDTGLYQIVPFVVKPATHDLTDSERRKFRLRKTLVIDGVEYVAYYLRKLNIEETPTSMVLTSIDDGQKQTEVWTPSVTDLRPRKPEVGYENDASYLTIVSNVSVTFDQQDIKWFLEAMKLLFGDENYMITELAYCTAVDKPIVREYPMTGGQTPSTAIANRQLKEVVATQAAYFISTMLTPTVHSKGFTYSVNLGISEPLFSTNKG